MDFHGGDHGTAFAQYLETQPDLVTALGFDANEARDLIEQLRRHGYLDEDTTGLRLPPGYEYGFRGSQSRS